ncbi:MAG TPA: hypothetical protein VIJ27_06380 [Mucilaginibacter sp.]
MKLPKQIIDLLFFIVLLTALITSSCKKNNINDITVDATVIYSGDPAADGCGWEMKINNKDSIYNAPNLPVAYQTANLPVKISYHKLTARYHCSDIADYQGPGITEIQLDGIKTR